MTKQNKLRYSEYYDMQSTFDRIYADSKNGKVFTHLMEIISSADNIKLAYRSIKRNSGSMTSGTDKKNISENKTTWNTVNNRQDSPAMYIAGA